jgi:prefoldin subunit 5
LETRIADIERADDTIPKQDLDRIATLDARIEQIQAAIDAKESEMAQLKQDYAADLKRVLELYNLPEEST